MWCLAHRDGGASNAHQEEEEVQPADLGEVQDESDNRDLMVRRLVINPLRSRSVTGVETICIA